MRCRPRDDTTTYYDNEEQQQATRVLSMRRLLGKSSSAAYESVTAPSLDVDEEDDADANIVDAATNEVKLTNKEGGSTITSSVVNLVNTIVGAGMLGLPGAMGSTGWASGIIIIVISALFSAHGLVLLSKAACLTGRPSSFYSVALASVPRFTIVIDAAVALKCFGVATGMSRPVVCRNIRNDCSLMIKKFLQDTLVVLFINPIPRRISRHHILQYGEGNGIFIKKFRSYERRPILLHIFFTTHSTNLGRCCNGVGSSIFILPHSRRLEKSQCIGFDIRVCTCGGNYYLR